MQGGNTGSVVPGWSANAFDPNYVRTAKTASSHLRAGLPGSFGGIELSHVSCEMLAYWHDMRGGKPMPDAAAIRPAGFRELLPYSRYLVWEAPDILRIRVFGSALSAALGADLTGYNLLDLFTPDARGVETARFRALHEQPCGNIIVRRSHIAGGGEREIEMIHLPVSGRPDGEGDGTTGGGRILSSVMVRDIPERWDGEADRSRAMDFLQMAFIDVGFGVPDAMTSQ